MFGKRIIGTAVWLAMAVAAVQLLGTLGNLGIRMLDRPQFVGALILGTVTLICLAASFFGLRALAEILIRGKGIACIYGDKSRDAIVFLASISATSVCLAYLAITDILKDYAGTMLTLPNGEPIRSVLATWAQCEGEWTIVFGAIATIALSQIGLLVLAVIARQTPRAV